MKKSLTAWSAAALCLYLSTSSFADHHLTDAEQLAVGPPAEMKELEPLNGEYTVKFFYKVDPTKPAWTETDATAVLSLVAGDSAQQMVFEGEMSGLPLSGIGLTTYDRETKQWQMTWVDSLGARISIYTGDLKDGALVVTGTDLNQGMTFHSKLTTYNMNEQGFDWKYELSMDGGMNYLEAAKATYRRK